MDYTVLQCMIGDFAEMDDKKEVYDLVLEFIGLLATVESSFLLLLFFF